MERWRNLWSRYHLWVGAVVAAVLALICYGFVLRLPFFFDDLPIMTWLRGHNWLEIWTQSSEGDFFRPLTFTVYKFGQLFPPGLSQVVLHGINLLLHWASAVLVMHIAKLWGRDPGEALLASALFVVFPFNYAAIPWVTAMPHQLVTTLTALAVFAALKAERDGAARWWGVSLLAMVLAPFAHESGVACAPIVGGIVVIQRGFHIGKGVVPIMLGGGVSVAVVILRSSLPGVGDVALAGLQDWVQNVMFFLHGLVYPVGPLIGWLVRHQGRQDLTLVIVATLALLAVVIWLARHSRDWRWSLSGGWWWAWASLPAAASLRYGYLYTAPRVHALAAVGLAILWAAIVSELGRVVGRRWAGWLLPALVGGIILTQNVIFLDRQRSLFGVMNGVYRSVLSAAEERDDAPLGFVNLPRGVGRPQRTYAMIHESVMFLPPYSNIEEFIAVNKAWRPADVAVYSPVLEETELMFDLQGEGLTWDGMRRFALEHQTVWLARWRENRFSLDYVGSIDAEATPLSQPMIAFDGGTTIESASVEEMDDGSWALTISWLAQGPVDARVFAHVLDVDGNVVTQADGPALGGMVPPWIWEPGDRIRDVRRVSPSGAGPFTVRVGLFGSEGRLPVYQNGIRCPEDAPTVATIEP